MRYFVSGGAGFIGSHLVSHLIYQDVNNFVTAYDNLSSGSMWHLKHVSGNDRVAIVKGDLKDLDLLTKTISGHDVVFHLASNPDISKAIQNPSIDFWEGTYLTQNLLEAMRIGEVKRIIYFSGSGVYGDCGELPVREDHGPLLPVSTYGSSKLACEALISAYCHLFDFQAWVYRFANVVGPKQTHGVAYDFIRKLKRDPDRLEIMGDGTQSKSYIHVDDVLNAIAWTLKCSRRKFQTFNIATGDYVTVNDIANLVVSLLGLDKKSVQCVYTGGVGGWKGDVPVVRFNLDKLFSTGWRPSMLSREALTKSIISMLDEAS